MYQGVVQRRSRENGPAILWLSSRRRVVACTREETVAVGNVSGFDMDKWKKIRKVGECGV